MKASSINAAINAALLAGAVVVVVAFPPFARGGDSRTHKLGDHPAVVVQRLNKAAGYDYASKFYPHPAWLYLYAEPPADASDVATTNVPPISLVRGKTPHVVEGG